MNSQKKNQTRLKFSYSKNIIDENSFDLVFGKPIQQYMWCMLAIVGIQGQSVITIERKG